MKLLSILGKTVLGYLSSSPILLFLPFIFMILDENSTQLSGNTGFTGLGIMIIILCYVLMIICVEVTVISLFQTLILYITNRYNLNTFEHFKFLQAFLIGLLYNFSLFAFGVYIISENSMPYWCESQADIWIILILPMVIAVCGYTLYVKLKF